MTQLAGDPLKALQRTELRESEARLRPLPPKVPRGAYRGTSTLCIHETARFWGINRGSREDAATARPLSDAGCISAGNRWQTGYGQV